MGIYLVLILLIYLGLLITKPSSIPGRVHSILISFFFQQFILFIMNKLFPYFSAGPTSQNKSLNHLSLISLAAPRVFGDLHASTSGGYIYNQIYQSNFYYLRITQLNDKMETFRVSSSRNTSSD